MNGETAIRVSGLGKRYQLGRAGGAGRFRYERFSEALVSLAKAPFRPAAAAGESSEFWALQEVSFELKEGEVLGVIGRNGAGKSTLLKLLSRITEPTTGEIELNGRVASLLEVGTGFHPELTGRENIFLNGAILGMSRAEILRKFDEIVAFAEVERFLDTPVKHYSSGMYVRLAFAVAAHLEPDILVVDEVLAVGDLAFQRKCLQKMHHVAGHGRTVLFVSHQLAAVESLCSKCLLLEQGRIAGFGPTAEITRQYTAGQQMRALAGRMSAPELDLAVTFAGGPAGADATFAAGEPAEFVLTVEPKRRLANADFTVVVYTLLGQRVLTFDTRYQRPEGFSFAEPARIGLRWPRVILCPGDYLLGVGVYENRQFVTACEELGRFRVEAGDFYGTGRLPDAGQGHVLTDAAWSFTAKP
jgi:lipopolysaccharide transport system ATP-binding protein